MESSIEKSLPICSADDPLIGAQEPTDTEINRAYNIFDAERMKYYKNVFVKTNRDFTGHKTSKPDEWRDFSEVVKICNANGFNIDSYIKYCLLNRLVPKSRGRNLSDISYLRNTPQIMDYAANKNEIERLFGIYRSIQRTILLIKRLKNDTGETATNTIKKLLSSSSLSVYLTTGTVSPYFVALLPNASVIIHKVIDRNCEDGTVLIDFCNRIREFSKSAKNSLSMFYPSAMCKTLVEMCS